MYYAMWCERFFCLRSFQFRRRRGKHESNVVVFLRFTLKWLGFFVDGGSYIIYVWGINQIRSSTSSFFPYNLFNVCKYSKSIKKRIENIYQTFNQLSYLLILYLYLAFSSRFALFKSSQHFYLFSQFHRKKVSDLFYYILVRHIRQVLCELRFILTFEMFDKCFH